MPRIALFLFFLLLSGRALWAQTPSYTVQLRFTPAANEFFTHSFLAGSKLMFFTTTIDTKNKRTKLKAYGFDAQRGDCLWNKSIDSVKVGKWQTRAGKGGVWQDFSTAVAATLSGSAVVPFEYQFRVSYSPDHSKILAYFYDYSQPTLSAHLSLFDSTLALLRSERVPIDNGVINYGLMVGNQGQVFILNSGVGGSIQLVEYNGPTGQANLLEVPAKSSGPRSLRLFLNGEDAWVASTIEGRQGLVGINLVRFDLKKKVAVHAQFQPLPESLSNKLSKSESGLRNVVLEDFWVDGRHEASFLLQQKTILASGYAYNAAAVNNPLLWQTRKAVVQFASLSLLTYDTLGVLLDEKSVAPNEQQHASEAYEKVSLLLHPYPGGNLAWTNVSAKEYQQVVDSQAKVVLLEKTGQSYSLKTYR